MVHLHSLKNMPTILYGNLNMSFLGQSSHIAIWLMLAEENLITVAYLPKPRLTSIHLSKLMHFSFVQ
jgi:hypothetical protein